MEDTTQTMDVCQETVKNTNEEKPDYSKKMALALMTYTRDPRRGAAVVKADKL